MGCDGWLLNPEETPYVDLHCYKCGRTISSGWDESHVGCLVEVQTLTGPVAALPIAMELIAEWTER